MQYRFPEVAHAILNVKGITLIRGDIGQNIKSAYAPSDRLLILNTALPPGEVRRELWRCVYAHAVFPHRRSEDVTLQIDIK